MNRIEKFTHLLSSSVKAPYATRLFTLLIFLWFTWQAISVWSLKDILWGSESAFLRSPRQSTLLNNFFFHLVYRPQFFNVVFVIHFVSAILSLFEFKWSFITRSAVWITGMMMYVSAPHAYNSGVLVMLLMAFYSIFIYTKTTSPFRNIITNLSRYAMIIQVMMIYLVSSIYKLSGSHWISGNAVYYALNIDFYSSPFLQKMSEYSWFWMMMTFAFFAYQILFPFVLFSVRHRNWFLLLGVGFHLLIAFSMHIWDFALAMIFCYALFMKENHAKALMPFRTLRL